MVTTFLQAQESDYFQNMMSAMGKPFAEAIKIGEMVENGLKTGRILSQSAIRATSQAIQGGSGGIAKGKKREETFMASSGKRRSYTPGPLFSERTPQHYYPHQDLAYTPQPYSVMNTQPYVRPPQQANRSQAPPPRNQPPYRNHYNPQLPQNNFRPQEPPRRQTFIPIGEPYSTQFPKLVQMGFLQPVPQTRHNPASPAYKAGVRDEEVPNVTNNLLLAHNNGPLIGMICEDKEFDPALKAIIAIVRAERKPKAAPKQDKGEKKTNTVKTELEKKAETKTEKMVPSKNEVLYIPRGRSEKPRRFEIKKGNTDNPMTDPSTVPWNYQQTLVTYKGKEITGELPENTSAGKYSDIREVNNATRKRFPPKKPVSAKEAEAFFQKMNMLDFEVVDQLRKYPEQVSMLSLLMRSAEHQKILLKTLNEANNDLPPEGAAHNKALHLTVKCEDYYVKRVMLDGGSGVDICPLSTLQRMEIGTGRIRPNNVCVRAFDGIKRDTLGEIDLILTIGPVEFEVTFQVLDMDTSYNFLLGRPWIHAAGAVPTTLYQMVKFEYEYREIVYEEGKPCPQPFLSNASIMVAKEMIRQGFKPEEGLGKSLQGITEPITLPSTKKLFGIGFHPTPKYEYWAKKRRNEG
ncbi:uncharacterized protein [Nicotiana sylvestris]|uniref:uncharacterized protein n=1 Tax=Nicotiana sylvestris TaxID=4096 RepID=UPI00388CB40F